MAVAINGVADAAQAHAAHDVPLNAVETDRALHQRHLDGAASLGIRPLICHYAETPVSSSRLLPRIRAMAMGSFSESRPAMVARTTL